MANIDLQSLISQLSVNTGGQSGIKTPGQPSDAGQLFGSILGQQQTLQSDDVAGGKALPGGNDLPVIKGESLPGVTPAMVEVAQALVQLAENPQVAGSLSVQELQNQFKQLLRSEDGIASEASLDDLSALTNLLLAADTTAATPVANVSNRTSVDQTITPELNDEQLLQTATTMGVEPAVAATVLQATQVVAPTVTPAATITEPLTAAQVLSSNSQSAAPQVNLHSNVQPAIPTSTPAAVPSVEPVVTQNLNQGGATPTNPVTAGNTGPQQTAPTVNNPATVVQQSAAQNVTDDVVIQVRQAAQQATQQGQSAQVASSVSAQEYFQQRVGRNAGANTVTTANPTSQPLATDSIRLADNLISKLDQVNNPAPAATTEPTMQAAGQLTGASFKAMAQFSQTTNFAATAPTTAEVPVTEGGSRLQTLMQGDTAAQQAARNMQNQLGQQLQRMVRDGQWQANINLNPARLGQIRINMTMEDGVLTTQLLSANQGVRELLEGSMPRLRELLEESGLQLGQFDVGSDAGNQQQFAHQEEDQGVVTQVVGADEVNTNAAAVPQSQHDGDLDTFA